MSCFRRRRPHVDAMVPIASTLVVLVLMVSLADLTREREIIFPEVAALLTGLFLAPRLAWRTTMTRMFLLLTACAVLGTLVSMYVPGPLPLRMTVAYMGALALLMTTGTTVAPIISAAVLPGLLGTRGWVYPVSAAALALVCALLRLLAEHLGLKPRELVKPHRGVWGGPRAFALRTALVAVWTFLACAARMPFAAAPPLLVAYTQFSRRRNPIRKNPPKAILAVIGCAILGAASRGVLTEWLGLHVAFAVALTTLGVAACIRLARFYFPPAAAMAILAFLVPASQLFLYPTEALVGITALVYAEKGLSRLT